MRDRVLQENLDYTLFSWSKQKGIDPIAVKSAQGVYLYDYDGKKYIDFSSGLMNVNIGHGNQRIAAAVLKQMQELAYVTPGCATAVRGQLGKRLAELMPTGLNKSFFTLCGASAIENAVKLARVYTGRHKILSRYQSYHGSSYGAISAGGDPRKLPADAQQAPNFVHYDLPYAYRWPFGKESLLEEAVAQLERIIRYEGPENIAAILLEGESGSSGCLQYPNGYLKEVRRLCNQFGILLIIDEVMSGFGRTGQWFGFQHHDIVPDMVAMAKGLTSGYLPLGCLMVQEKIADAFNERMLPLGLTYSAHPVCCAAALETIQVYEDERLLENCREMGQYISEQISSWRHEHPCIGDWRMTGLLGCLELVRNAGSKEPMAPFNASPTEMKVMNAVAARIRELGMYTFVRWSYLFIAPPLSINKKEVDEGLAIIRDALRLADSAVER